MRFLLTVFLILGLLAVPVMAQSNDTVVNETGNMTGEDVIVNVTENDTIDLNETAADVNATANLTVIEADITASEEEVGALPGDFFYGFKRFFENVDKFFTLDKSEKAKKHAKYGKLRAVEAHIMTKKAQSLMAEGKLTEANQTLELIEQITADQEEEMGDAQEQLEAAVEEGSADEADVEEVQTELRNSIVVLQRVYEKVPESAKDGIARALNNSINNQQRHEEKMQEKNALKIQKKTQSMVTAGSEENETESNETETVKPAKGNKPDKVKGNDTEDEDAEEDDETESEVNQTGKGNGKGRDK